MHTAHTNLRSEAATNAATLRGDRQRLHAVQDALLNDLQTPRTLETQGQAPRNTPAGLTANWSWNALVDSAYSTARDTGVFALMPYEEVQRIDGVYTQQHYVNDAANAYIFAVSRLRVPLQGGRTLADLSAGERSAMIDSCSNALVSIELLQDLSRSLGADYEQLAAD